MVKHNNIIPNQHFHKDWQRHVRTWFNQPAKKVARRAARVAKAKRIAPRPIGKLKPIVRGQTNKYNNKVRAGRGFTLEELKAAKIHKKEARGLGISVDHRRKNRTEEAFTLNVNRLKLYRSKLVVFPRKPTSQRVKAGDAKVEERKAAKQVLAKNPLPIVQPKRKVRARRITGQERDTNTQAVLRKARTDALRWGAREKTCQGQGHGSCRQIQENRRCSCRRRISSLRLSFTCSFRGRYRGDSSRWKWQGMLDVACSPSVSVCPFVVLFSAFLLFLFVLSLSFLSLLPCCWSEWIPTCCTNS